MVPKVALAIWNVLLLGLLIGMIVLTVGVERARPLTQTDAIAPELSHRLGVPEERLRKELYPTLLRGWQRRSAVMAAPYCLLAVLLGIRAVMEWRIGPTRPGQ